ncbi:MAG: MFS transporter [Halanaerobium sp.]
MKFNLKSDKLPFESPFYYGWVIVFISALGVMLSGPGQTYSVSIFIDSFIEDLGWSRSLVSLLYSGGTLLAGLTVPFVGRLFDKYGHRKIMTLVAFVFGISLLAISFVFTPLMLFVGFYFIRLLGQSSMVIGPSTIVPKWFSEKRGRALSLMSMGGRVGAAAFPLLNTWIIAAFGWRTGWRGWAILIWLVMTPLAWFLVREKPEAVGLEMEEGLKKKEENSTADNSETKADLKKVNVTAESKTLAEARRTSAFWLLLFCIFVPAMVGTGLTFHIVSIMGERGLSPDAAAFTLSVMAVVSFPATFFAGFVLEKITVRKLLIIIFTIYSISVIWLINIQNMTMALIFGVLYGLIQGFHRVNVNMIWPSYFGLKHLGSIRGASQLGGVIGAALGPFPIGFAYDYFGGYTEILWLMFIFPVLAVAAAYFARVPE